MIGARTGVSPGLIVFLQRVKTLTTHPLLVGFGISTAADACGISRHSDGVIVGSAVIQRLSDLGLKAGLRSAESLIQSIKNSLRGVKNGY